MRVAALTRQGPLRGNARRGEAFEGGARVPEAQRLRMLAAATQVVFEEGYGAMTIAKVANQARVSRRTFYDLFEDREDCFLAAFNEAIARLAEAVLPAYAGSGAWLERLRRALGTLLETFESDPALASLVVLGPLGAGPRIAERRAEVLASLERAVDEGRAAGTGASEPPPLTAECLVGAVFGVIHARLLEHKRPGALMGALNELMAMIALPYLGQSAARKELTRPMPVAPVPDADLAGIDSVRQGNPLEGLPMRLTYRTLRVLEFVAAQPGASNREVAEGAEVHDQGQMSKLLGRLERLELLSNTGEGHPSGAPNAWHLTQRGQDVERATAIRTQQ
jgi:AcrR family transcriptional regulator